MKNEKVNCGYFYDKRGNTRGGFALYLTFVVTTVLFFLTLGGLDLALSAVDMSRSGVLSTISFHAADGGLELGLARLRKDFTPFSLAYSSHLDGPRSVRVTVEAFGNGITMNLAAEARVFEGKKLAARRKLMRLEIENRRGRRGCGTFVEDT